MEDKQTTTQLNFESAEFVKKYGKAFLRTFNEVGAGHLDSESVSKLTSDLDTLDIATIVSRLKSLMPQHTMAIESVANLVTLEQVKKLIPKAKDYVAIQNEFLKDTQEFITKLQNILEDKTKAAVGKEAINHSLVTEQYEFANKISSYAGQQEKLLNEFLEQISGMFGLLAVVPQLQQALAKEFSNQSANSILRRFLGILREQMTFKTDGNGEKITTLLGNRNYFCDEQFSNIYKELTGASNNEQDLLSAFQTDSAIMYSQIPSPEPTINMSI